jgi:hypothetical protein
LINEAFELDASIATLTAELASSAKRYQKAITTVAASAAAFSALEGELRRTLGGEQLERVDARVAAYRPGCIGRLMSLFKGQSEKEADNRRVIAEALLAERAAGGKKGAADTSRYAGLDLPKLTG